MSPPYDDAHYRASSRLEEAFGPPSKDLKSMGNAAKKLNRYSDTIEFIPDETINMSVEEEIIYLRKKDEKEAAMRAVLEEKQRNIEYIPDSSVQDAIEEELRNNPPGTWQEHKGYRPPTYRPPKAKKKKTPPKAKAKPKPKKPSVLPLYEVLGCKAGQRLSTIKKQFRILAFKYHPDKNPDDPSAEAKFKQVTAAFKELSKVLSK